MPSSSYVGSSRGPERTTLREFAWRHLWAEATRDYTILGLADPSTVACDPARWADRMRRNPEQSDRLSEFAEWMHINPSGLSIHDWAGSYHLTQGGAFAQLDLEEDARLVSGRHGTPGPRGAAGRPLLSPDATTARPLGPGPLTRTLGGANPPVAEVAAGPPRFGFHPEGRPGARRPRSARSPPTAGPWRVWRSMIRAEPPVHSSSTTSHPGEGRPSRW